MSIEKNVEPIRRTAMITGASAGIGRAAAIALGARGWTLALGARRIDALEETAIAVREAGGNAFCCHLDLADDASISNFFFNTKAAIGGIDVLINNAGATTPSPLLELTREQFRSTLEVNLLGPISLTQHLIGDWQQHEHKGTIIFISSEHVRTEFPHLLHYGASKIAMEFVARGLRRELHEHSIRIGIMRVGATDTEFRFNFSAEQASKMVQMWAKTGVPTPTQKRMTAAEVAEVIAFAITAGPSVNIDCIDLHPSFTL